MLRWHALEEAERARQEADRAVDKALRQETAGRAARLRGIGETFARLMSAKEYPGLGGLPLARDALEPIWASDHPRAGLALGSAQRATSAKAIVGSFRETTQAGRKLMRSATLDRLDQFEKEARREKRPRLYLRRLSPLHYQWHMQRVRRIGFLLFHWHVVEHFKALGLHRQMNLKADTRADFNPGGRFKAAHWEASMGGVPDSQSIPDLVGYSRAIEGWHNEAHMVIGDVTGLDMMDARANVFFPEFWGLHFFINERFEEQLRAYAKAANLGKRAPAAVVGQIEREHPGTVARI